MSLVFAPPFPIIPDVDGQPLENGYLFFGQPNQEPRQYPVEIYWDGDLTQPANQPVRTINGFPTFNGSPARIWTQGDYSILVLDRNGSLVYYAPTRTVIDPNDIGLGIVRYRGDGTTTNFALPPEWVLVASSSSALVAIDGTVQDTTEYSFGDSEIEFTEAPPFCPSTQDPNIVLRPYGGTASGAGDVVGPDGTVSGNFASFSGTTGKIIADSGYSAADFATAAQGAKADTAVQPGAVTGSGLTMTTARLLGRTTAASGAIEEISVGSNLTLSGGTLSATGSGDVVGPASSTNGAVALFSGTTGKLLQNGSVPGTMYTQNANSVAITGGSITGITDLAVADGGTGASDASGARTNLGLGTMATQNASAVSITGGTAVLTYVQAASSAGLALKNSSGTDVVTVGPGPGTGVSFVGGVNIGGALAVNNSSVTTDQTTLNLFNTTATTLNFAGAATTLTMGAASAAVTIRGTVSLGGAAGAESLRVTIVGSAVNRLQAAGAATGGLVALSAQGTDANRGIGYAAGGSGSNAYHRFSNGAGEHLLIGSSVTSAIVNRFRFAGNVTGSPPNLNCDGPDADIDAFISPKGDGLVRFGTFTTLGLEIITGYITIKDAGGTTRKVAVIA